jgi:hypothetical protein
VEFIQGFLLAAPIVIVNFAVGWVARLTPYNPKAPGLTLHTAMILLQNFLLFVPLVWLAVIMIRYMQGHNNWKQHGQLAVLALLILLLLLRIIPIVYLPPGTIY